MWHIYQRTNIWESKGGTTNKQLPNLAHVPPHVAGSQGEYDGFLADAFSLGVVVYVIVSEMRGSGDSQQSVKMTMVRMMIAMMRMTICSDASII